MYTPRKAAKSPTSTRADRRPPAPGARLGVLLAFVVLAACTGGRAETPRGTEAPGTPAVAATPASGPAPGAVSPPSTPTPPPLHPAQQAVLAAALREYNAVTEADCQANNPQNRTCARVVSTPEQIERGIAQVSLGGPGGGAMGVMGRDPAGAWKRWLGYQNPPYQLLNLPGDVRVCAGGDRLNVRSAPAITGQITKVLDDQSVAHAEEFVLTEPEQTGPDGAALKPGYGWYRLAAANEGWAYSKFLADAALGDCKLHDAQEKP